MFRSLENDPGPPTAMNTVIDAVRGVRKLPVPVVKTGSSQNRLNGMGPTPLEQTLFTDLPNQQQQQQPFGPQQQPQVAQFAAPTLFPVGATTTPFAAAGPPALVSMQLVQPLMPEMATMQVVMPMQEPMQYQWT